MALTRDYKITIRERLDRDPAFREAVLAEAEECLLAGEIEIGMAILRQCIFQPVAGRREPKP